MKIAAIIPLTAIAIPGIRAHAGATLRTTEGAFIDWEIHVRGPAVFVCSPPGWRPGQPPDGSTRQVYEIPRSDVHLQWDMAPDDTLDGVAKWSPPKYVAPVGPFDDKPMPPPSRSESTQDPLAVEGANPVTQDSPTPASAQVTFDQKGKKR